MENVNTLEEAAIFLRKNANTKETVYKTEISYGHKLVTIKYFSKKDGIELGSVYKTNKIVVHARIYIGEDSYTFTEYGKQKVRPLV